jgi:hypothetical protein
MKKLMSLGLLLLGASPSFAGVAFTRQVLDVIRVQKYYVEATYPAAPFSCSCALEVCTSPNDVLLSCEGATNPFSSSADTNLIIVESANGVCAACACNDGGATGTTVTARAQCLLYP